MIHSIFCRNPAADVDRSDGSSDEPSSSVTSFKPLRLLNIPPEFPSSFDTPSDVACNHTLFVRHFYEDLFDAMRKHRIALLLGSAGTSKSVYHYYMIYRYIQAWQNSK